MDTRPKQIALSFDTTGSMRAAIATVRREVKDLAVFLLNQIPNLEIAILSHGDYCDARGTGFISSLDFTSNPEEVVDFIENRAPNTGGGDSDEAYEEVLYQVRTSLSWKDGSIRAYVLIGDAEPHSTSYNARSFGFHDLVKSWRNEATSLVSDMGVTIYPVQCLSNRYANSFYGALAEISGTPKLELSQFADVNDLLTAIMFKASGDNELEQFDALYLRNRSVSFQSRQNFERLAGRAVSTKVGTGTKKAVALGLEAVSPSRFQVIRVEEDTRIDEFVRKHSLPFKVGRGFYQWTKSSIIQGYKEVVLRDAETGEFFAGTDTRSIMGLPAGATIRQSPPRSSEWTGFIQSTSYTRILRKGTLFLYEMEEG